MKAASLQELLSLVSPREGEFFMDPGSGVGQPTLLAAMLFPLPPPGGGGAADKDKAVERSCDYDHFDVLRSHRLVLTQIERA